MSAKERFKALVFVISLLTIGHVGNFYPLLLENAEAIMVAFSSGLSHG